MNATLKQTVAGLQREPKIATLQSFLPSAPNNNSSKFSPQTETTPQPQALPTNREVRTSENEVRNGENEVRIAEKFSPQTENTHPQNHPRPRQQTTRCDLLPVKVGRISFFGRFGFGVPPLGGQASDLLKTVESFLGARNLCSPPRLKPELRTSNDRQIFEMRPCRLPTANSILASGRMIRFDNVTAEKALTANAR